MVFVKRFQIFQIADSMDEDQIKASLSSSSSTEARYMGIMEKKMETTILCRVILGFIYSLQPLQSFSSHKAQSLPLCIIQKQPFDSIGPPSICLAISSGSAAKFMFPRPWLQMTSTFTTIMNDMGVQTASWGDLSASAGASTIALVLSGFKSRHGETVTTSLMTAVSP